MGTSMNRVSRWFRHLSGRYIARQMSSGGPKFPSTIRKPISDKVTWITPDSPHWDTMPQWLKDNVNFAIYNTSEKLDCPVKGLEPKICAIKGQLPVISIKKKESFKRKTPDEKHDKFCKNCNEYVDWQAGSSKRNAVSDTMNCKQCGSEVIEKRSSKNVS